MYIGEESKRAGGAHYIIAKFNTYEQFLNIIIFLSRNVHIYEHNLRLNGMSKNLGVV